MKIFFENQYGVFLEYMKNLRFSSKPFNCPNLIYVPEFITYYTEKGPKNIKKGSLICISNSSGECDLKKQISLETKILNIMAIRCRFNQE